ncbi:sulfatase-like hydrolase/transferase [Candidatus Hydrogenedentota bacterium]
MNLPNVLLITTDQHNADIFGYAGNPVVETPNIDRLAETGAVFTSAFTPHPTCTPARTSIFTGQYAKKHTVYNNINVTPREEIQSRENYLPADVVAFPEALAKNGYDTSLFGKLHTKQNGDANFGIQLMKLAEGKGQFVRLGSPDDDYRCYLKEKGYSDEVWKTWELPEYGATGRVTSQLPEEDYIDVWTATEAVKHLAVVERPFFSWVSFSGPHTPWDPPVPYDAMYNHADISMPRRRQGELEEKNPWWVDCIAQTIPACPAGSIDFSREGGIENAYNRFSDEQIQGMLAAYYGQVTLIDKQIGRVLDTLEKRNLLENTIVIFTADHGDCLGNNWAFYKQAALYDSVVRVPMVVSWPGHVREGSTCDKLVSLIDIAPTLLDLAGVEAPVGMDGMSLCPFLEGRNADWRDEIPVVGGPVNAIMTDTWKYIEWRRGFQELYNRKEDSGSLYNVAGRPENAAICDELSEHLNAAL